MADKISASKRSDNMRAIRSSDTQIELALRRALRRHGLTGYRLHRRDLPGRPDVAYVGRRLAVFVDGCFWHGCPVCYVAPTTKSEYWQDKLRRNIERDRAADERLRSDGWTVLRFWEHDIEADVDACVARVAEQLGTTAGPDRTLQKED